MTDIRTGSTAFITGGAQGIGLGIARALAERGVKLALADIDATALDAARSELAGRTTVRTFVLDVRDREAFARAADETESALGPVCLLFNNAGVAGGCSVSEMTYDHWDWVLGINLNGVVNGLQTFIPRMIEASAGGYIVNTSSGAGLINAGTGFLYSTSKFAVVGLSEALNNELAPYSVGVSVLCPGPVDTDIVQHTLASGPRREPLTPEAEAGFEQSVSMLRAGLSIDQVGRQVLAGVERDQLYILTDDLIAEGLRERARQLEAALPSRLAALPV